MMVQIVSCDHHGPEGTVPSTRSRARMLAQLRAATALSEAIAAVATDGRVQPLDGTYAFAVPLAAWAHLTQAWLAWLTVEPVDPDDFAPPVDPPSTTRVPPDDPSPPADIVRGV